MKYSGKTVVGGKNWPLHLLDLHNMTLWNFSMKGSVIDSRMVPRDIFKTSLLNQYELYIKKMIKRGKFYNSWNSNDTLFSLWIGCNDIRFIKRNYNNNKKIPRLTLIFNIIIQNMFNTIEKMYKTGAKNFLILNIPPLDKAPLNDSGKYNYYKYDVMHFNTSFNIKAEILAKKYKDINIIVYNTREEYEYIMNNYKEFNLIDGHSKWSANKTANLKNYFWLDRSHISFRGNEILAKDINDLLSSINN
ncbi:carbohydrate esterase family 16 protein [Piromyces sp. E2]|nr:carbohydrate esterase family 16 protein [Piromyces sp. E2]|eukprot:OUM60162.1 carbohydrate esterase family 16 protein [Piromyces sp. E2]